MSYYGCGVHALPEGSSSPSRLALVARRLGYDGIIISNHTGSGAVFRPMVAEKVAGIDVVLATEVVARNQRSLHSTVSSLRERYDLIAVHGGPDAINRVACENPKVDILAHPDDSRFGLSIAAARAAKLNQVAIAFDLSPMIRTRGKARSRWLGVFGRNLALSRKFGLAKVITMGARSHLDLRSPREVLALAELAGMEADEADAALRYPAELLRLNKKRWAGPGVEVL